MLLDDPVSSSEVEEESEITSSDDNDDDFEDDSDSDYTEGEEIDHESTASESVKSLTDSVDDIDNDTAAAMLGTADVVLTSNAATRITVAPTTTHLSSNEAAAAWANVFQKNKKPLPSTKTDKTDKAKSRTAKAEGSRRRRGTNLDAPSEPSLIDDEALRSSKTAKPPPPRPPPVSTVPLSRVRALLRANPNVKSVSADAAAAVAAAALGFLGMFVTAAGAEMSADGRKQLTYAHCARAVEAADAFSLGRVALPPDPSDATALGDAAVVRRKRLRVVASVNPVSKPKVGGKRRGRPSRAIVMDKLGALETKPGSDVSEESGEEAISDADDAMQIDNKEGIDDEPPETTTQGDQGDERNSSVSTPDLLTEVA